MFLQRADYTVEIKVVPQDRFDEQARAGILRTVAANLPNIDISLSLVESIPRTKANKWRPVVTEVQPAQRAGA
jgi:hypothetical protein